MKLGKYILYSSIVISLIGFIFYLFIFSAGVDYNTKMPKDIPCQTKPLFNLSDHLEGLKEVDLKKRFPYDLFLDSVSICDINSIKYYLGILDTLYPMNSFGNQEVLSMALTKELEKQIRNSLVTFNSDSIIQIIKWSDKYLAYSEIETKKTVLYQSVYLYWFDYLSNKLEKYYKSDPTIMYNSMFKYINFRLIEKRYGCSINKSDMEKILDNYLEKDYGRLMNKFRTSSTIYQKLFVVLAISYILFSCYAIIKLYKNYKNETI